MVQHYNQTTDLFSDEQPIVYAGFWERFGAAFIDGIIVSAAGFALAMIFPPPEGQYLGVANILNVIVGWLYFALQESSPAQATLGKRAIGLRVTDADGGRINFGQATGRHFGKWISTIILLIGYLMMLWDDKSQTLHDKIAGTFVVKA